MILRCTRGCSFDTKHRLNHALKLGMRCPSERRDQPRSGRLRSCNCKLHETPADDAPAYTITWIANGGHPRLLPGAVPVSWLERKERTALARALARRGVHVSTRNQQLAWDTELDPSLLEKALSAIGLDYADFESRYAWVFQHDQPLARATVEQ